MGKSHIHTHISNPYKSTFPSTMSDDRRVRVKKTTKKQNCFEDEYQKSWYDRACLPVRVGYWLPPLRRCLSNLHFNYFQNMHLVRCPCLQLMLTYRQNTVG